MSLHSYRYAWAERAKTAGYPERFAQEALGHNSKAVHRAYASRDERAWREASGPERSQRRPRRRAEGALVRALCSSGLSPIQ